MARQAGREGRLRPQADTHTHRERERCKNGWVDGSLVQEVHEGSRNQAQLGAQTGVLQTDTHTHTHIHTALLVCVDGQMDSTPTGMCRSMSTSGGCRWPVTDSGHWWFNDLQSRPQRTHTATHRPIECAVRPQQTTSTSLTGRRRV